MTPNASGWRPTTPAKGDGAPATHTGNRALMLEEPLIFEIGSDRTTYSSLSLDGTGAIAGGDPALVLESTETTSAWAGASCALWSLTRLMATTRSAFSNLSLDCTL